MELSIDIIKKRPMLKRLKLQMELRNIKKIYIKKKLKDKIKP